MSVDVHRNSGPPQKLYEIGGPPSSNGDSAQVGTKPYNAPKRTKPAQIAIVGKAPSSMQLAPYKDQSWEIWSINDSIYRNMVPRASRQFELHNIELTKQPGYDDYYPWLKTCPIPVYVNAVHPEISNGVLFPREKVLEAFPIYVLTDGRMVRRGLSYYTNSISYLIALAIWELEGVEDGSAIGLWGVDMAQHGRHLKSEYAAQRPSCEVFIGIGIGRGIKMVIPEECDLLKCKSMYGFDTWQDQHKKAAVRKKELEQRIQQARALAHEKDKEATFLEGALEDMFYNDQWI